MEELTMLETMFNILNSDNPNKKSVIETLPILLNSYNVHGKFDVYKLILTSTHNLCFQVFDPQFENSVWNDSNVSSENLKYMLIYFIEIITKHSETDIIQLFQQYVELANKVNFKDCDIEKLRNIEFCMQKLFVSSLGKTFDCVHLNRLRNTLLSVLNEPCLNKHKLDAIMVFLNNIVSINYIPDLWQNIKPMIKTYPDRTINLLFSMQCVFFDPQCVSVILNDIDFWNLLYSLLSYENNIIRTYNYVILKLSCSQLLNENIDIYPKESKHKLVKVWNDYVIVMETLENTQQHLTLPILNTAKKLVPHKTNDDCDNYKLPLECITAMCSKMSKHSSKYVVLASIDIITNLPTKLLKVNKKIIQSFVDSLNDIFLYKMTSELCIDQPQLECTLSLWFNELMMSDDGHEVFSILLSNISTIKWTIVPLLFLTKSLLNISSNPPLGFNVVSHVLKIKSSIEDMPNSYLKTAVLLFLFEFSSKFFANVDTEICCDLFDCIIVCCKNTKSWNYIVDSVHKIKNRDCFDQQLLQCLSGQQKIRSTALGLLFVDNINSMEKLNNLYLNAVDATDLIEFLECLLNMESNYGQLGTHISQILDKYVWPQTTQWVEKCLKILEKRFCEDPVAYSYLDKVLYSKRIVNTANIMNIWLTKCKTILVERLGNYYILAIYSWIGKYATMYSTDSMLKNNWLSFTKEFISMGYFSSSDFYFLKKARMHIIPELDIVNTFFQYSTVPKEQILDIFDWLTKKTIERHDNYWNIYFSTAKTLLCKFPLQMHLKKVILFVENCWEFLISCRVSCFPNSFKSFIEMAFHRYLLSEKNYIMFVENQIVQNLLTEKYRDNFNVCLSLHLLKYFKVDKSNVFSILESRLSVSEFFAKCMLFSIDRYGAHKIEWDTLEYVRTLDNFPLINNISTECLPDDRCLRFSAIKYLHEHDSGVLWKNVLHFIVKTELSLRDRKYFHNSKAYRVKQRAVQVLLIVACDIWHESKIFDEDIYNWSLSSLKEVCHIHSVAYPLMWLLVLIYNKCPTFCDFWSDFRRAQENQNYLCSFISILYHLKKLKNNDTFEVEAKKHLLKLCFSNGYKIRFFSQVTICRLFPCNSGESEWSLIRETVENVIAKNEQTKKHENPFNDFFYQLDMVNYLSLKNVCVEMPRLLNIVHEERFPTKWLNDLSVTKIYNNKYDLSQCSVSSFIEKKTTSVSSNEIIDTAQNAQRKYIPSQPQDERSCNSSLIVVASLVDKVTNLGGLTRTCQVFGVSTLVVDSLSCVEKREFTALSMTAEKHQYIIEVREKNLKSYLQKKKSEGYQIVAAEQTTSSVKLHNFELQFKCVLLLGNETFGIPHCLLSVVDKCVEIEQFGIVRSLNVHVAGSLFIWEYAKQHRLLFSN